MKTEAARSITDTRPADAVARWPDHRPVAAVLAGDPSGRSRFSLIAEPTEIIQLDTLAELLEHVVARPGLRATPFGAGWIASIAYHAGFEIEPTAGDHSCIHDPAVTLARVDHGWVHDNRLGTWTLFGDPPAIDLGDDPASFSLGGVHGLDRQQRYESAVARAVDLIRAGDVFQVNLTHALSASFAGSPHGLFAALAGRLAPWHGCYLEWDDRAIASASPELFLEVTPEGRVITRPMKGTRPGDDRSLAHNPKDAAELAMIVDLMRNDLGRVCRFGSVRVDEGRAIEPHGGTDIAPHVWQGVATVTGELRDGVGIGELLRATVPPGSITGAPKVRAMQIIHELERDLGFGDASRGAYCGATGFIGDDGSASLAVTIRTAIVEGGVCRYPVGAGIVADSDPHGEWLETLVKARPFLELCEGGAP
ncbi:MAG: anthranilate synthase component I family protein [Planctomycetota bacterium]